MEYEEIKSFILSGCKFKYKSYDHKKAIEAWRLLPEDQKSWAEPNCYGMPYDLKERFEIIKTGSLRQIHFNPDGKMFRFKIGARYAKTFFIDDFGVNVWPILK